MENEVCGFDEAWIGKCKHEKPCAKHDGLICVSCGNPATHSCYETGQFVCGFPVCDDCEHTIFPNGTNGGVGFNEQPLPEGMKRHCKKTEQQFKPWYAREDNQQANA